MDFGDAVRAMKEGKRVAREGWNGKGMHAALMPGFSEGVPANDTTIKAHRMQPGSKVRISPYMVLFTAQGDIASWAPSGSDALAEDWVSLD